MRLMRKVRALLLALSLAGTVAASQTAVWADPPTTEEQEKAQALKKKGDAAMDAFQYADALAAYTEAYTLAKDPALLYNKGRAFQLMGRFPEALVELETFKSTAPPELLAKVPKLDALISDVRSRVANVIVKCNIAGAQVLVRDKVIGKTPIEGSVALVSGKAHIEVSAEGYFPYKKDLDLPGGQATTLDVKLATKAQNGILTVKSPVAGAAVSIDGQPAGTVPSEAVLTPGSHKVIVTREGYDDAEVTAIVVVGDRRDVEVLLAQKAGITKKWWFWTGIGAVVLTGAAVTAAFLIERKPSHGDGFSPNQVAGPLLKF